MHVPDLISSMEIIFIYQKAAIAVRKKEQCLLNMILKNNTWMVKEVE